MIEKNIETNSFDETLSLGKKFSSVLKKGDNIAFYGDLGAGKTTLIKGICDGLNVDRDVESPTFTLINEYQGDIPIYHIDCYREQNVAAWLNIGIEEYLFGEGITLIEWADNIKPLIPDDALNVKIEQDFERKNWRRFNFIFPENRDLENAFMEY